ncbi:MAG: hypothetical protein ACPGTS_00940, partial [Minisyncoccia bacterium]
SPTTSGIKSRVTSSSEISLASSIAASKIIKNFSPKVVIPMDYGTDRDTGMLDAFLKETSSDAKAIEKYVFKKKDLETLTGHVVVLDAQ